MSSDESRRSRALTSLANLRRAVVQYPTQAELDHGLDALRLRIAAGRVRQRRLVRWSVIGMSVVLSILVVWKAQLMRKNASGLELPALTYRIEGGSVFEGGYLHESGRSGVKLLFSEGSKLELVSGTRGRLRVDGKEGTHIAIENGTATFDIVPNRNRRWWVEVGPFLVTVKGTEFAVQWDPQHERFELTLKRGHVSVSGPISGGDLSLRAGQRLVVSLPRGETLITEESTQQSAGEAAAASMPAVATAATPQPASQDSSMPAGSSHIRAPSLPSSAKPQSERRWTEELARGQWDRILDDAERIGIEASLNTASSEDLFALANAARYRRRPDVAWAALHAERRRFPDSQRALDAIFLLGRVEESRGGGLARSIAWYDEYLTRAPAGAYAAEALGRKMTLTNELSGPARARPIAEEYLRRFPKGTYAGSARALLRMP